jgi:ribose transport system ATP-binding protein
MEGLDQSLATEAGPRPALSVTALSKRFGGTRALHDVSLSVRPGEIHAFLGANGAGKSTLIKILAGVVKPDSGDVLLAGVPLEHGVRGNKIAFVHQDLGLIDSLTVGENMAMTYGYPRRHGFIDWRAVNAAAGAALENLGAPLPLDCLVAELSQAEKSIVAIARALVRNVEVLVLDEPTASLPEADVERLFSILRILKERQVGIVHVTHRLDEVFRIADAATVLRNGEVVATYRPIAVSPEQLVTDICGSIPVRRPTSIRNQCSVPVMQVSELCIGNAGPVSFDLGAAEILGLAGLRGQGQEDVGRAVAGLQRMSSGTISVGNKTARLVNAKAAIKAGIGFASSRRAEEGVATMLNVRENLFLNPLNFGRGAGTPQTAATERRHAAKFMEQFDVRPRDPEREINTLSGGNQQKVILARLAGREYRVVVLEEPTMGVDVGAKAEIYDILSRGAKQGTACLIISSDLDELVQLCDRVLAFRGGRIVAELDRSELSVAALTQEISGGATSVTSDVLA